MFAVVISACLLMTACTGSDQAEFGDSTDVTQRLNDAVEANDTSALDDLFADPDDPEMAQDLTSALGNVGTAVRARVFALEGDTVTLDGQPVGHLGPQGVVLDANVPRLGIGEDTGWEVAGATSSNGFVRLLPGSYEVTRTGTPSPYVPIVDGESISGDSFELAVEMADVINLEWGLSTESIAAASAVATAAMNECAQGCKTADGVMVTLAATIDPEAVKQDGAPLDAGQAQWITTGAPVTYEDPFLGGSTEGIATLTVSTRFAGDEPVTDEPPAAELE